jgi:arabinan endo-1,5-alpha-L-arabinosidase
VSANWPAGEITPRLSPYLLQAQQKWSVTPVANAGGYAGSPYFRISVAGTERSLTAAANGELTVLPAFTGAAEQLWRIDQLPDGTYRLMPKAVPGANATMALAAIGGSSPTLERVETNTDRQRWLLRAP